ncbi:gamma-glutamyl-phosphate reductase [Corynebacterium pseudotuberculosis]|uniref:glutamate-5-semialdehyde dehydrogenase n=1 Tax=Corynebacterium pseudotuberculosis TaxID=1719 RepID=UPI000259289E|nr:glutamate-5-semialdehyde dehydrogenase [Corynebacterium pseudotuberculosis]AFH91380.1 glutamate-5-semialdehyde dehydrogenase [Corynebacterium pseudotuberculosis 31]APB11398.1 gamma-glutamyl-phosphate reductase [Corynebacterium pseudotuberculosis]APB13442.1 gamma-glutamyl-phosphate reductase [Corynebacterium pseudotuberculosis]APB15485.1 gamma-glutamyl-phosphate reductase [Corynebacterium pseudotuberculosis]APB17531.1 gamma-glutamyl-phosphate reductase [Corynebacterium pseudotuberculosis]
MTNADIRSIERNDVLSKARAAHAISPRVARLSSSQKNAILLAAAEALCTRAPVILSENARDVEEGRANGMSESLIDRLSLDEGRIAAMADGLRQVASLADPVGNLVDGRVMPNGIQMRKVRVPLGVMGMVYEARPNVTVDAFGLALKSGNVALLRGSKSARYSNSALVRVLQDVLVSHDIPAEAVQLLPCETHESVQDLITARGLVDVVIPRGGAGLIEAVVTGATVPTIETGTGNCHFYIDRDVSDIDQAIEMLLNGKTRRCSVCNAAETVLIDSALPVEAQRKTIDALQRAGVTVHGDVDKLGKLGVDNIVQAEEADWAEEYLSMDIAARTVDGIEGALEHIRAYSTGHTEAIATGNIVTAQRFADEVDAAAVMINASTAFTDGEQYGMGAEIGISTQKLHARGPMALPELTTTKWILQGTGQTRP